MATHPLLVKAAQHTAQARAINDEFENKPMPAEAAREMDEHLSKAAEYRQRVQRQASLEDSEQWIAEPQYKHEMVHGEDIAKQFGHGKEITDGETKEYKRKAFFDYIRKGDNGISRDQKAALVEDATGQNLVPSDFAGTILTELPKLATIRNLAYVRPTTKNSVDVGNVVIDTAGWGKLETGDGNVDQDGLPATPAAKQSIKVWNLNALVKLGVDEMADSDENLAEIIQTALALKFAEVEDTAYAAGTGDGAFMPFAITHTVTQNISAAVDNTPTPDDLKKLTFLVPAQFRRGGSTGMSTGSRAVFLWHSKVEQAVSLMKDNNGNYLMQNRPSDSEPGTFMGFKWYSVDGLADPATAGIAQKSVVFGDLFNGYMIADRRSLTVQRLVELYAVAGEVGLLFTLRVGGDVIRPKALATYTL